MVMKEEKVKSKVDVLCSHLRHEIELLKTLLENIEKEDFIDDSYVNKIIVEVETDLKRLRHSVFV